MAAALLFVVQPMVGKMILPRGGGSPQVWITAMVFFQAVLLAGYTYAHVSVRRLGARRQILLHTVVLLLPALVLPVHLPDVTRPEGSSPSLWILMLLTLGVGAPFFVLASASPLLQSWFATTRHEAAGDPYFLYAASNTGSLLGLLAYPFLVEPLLPLDLQARGWAVGYGLFAALALGGAAVAYRSLTAHPVRTLASTPDADGRPVPGGQPGTAGSDDGTPEASRQGARPTLTTAPTPSDRAFWLVAAAIPSALLMGVTHFLTSRIAPVPLLWVLPLAIYLGTFILAFGPTTRVGSGLASRWVAILGVFVALAFLVRLGEPTWLITLLHLAFLGVGGLLAHRRLADARPSARYLTEFYLLLSLGGVLGGAFSALLAPVIFNDIAEYPLAVVLVALLRIPLGRRRRRRGTTGDDTPVGRHTAAGAEVTPVKVNGAARPGRALDLVPPALLLAYLFVGDRLVASVSEIPDTVVVLLLAFVPTVVVFWFSPRPIRFAAGLGALFLFAHTGSPYRGDVLLQERTFFGVYRVVQDPGERLLLLYHGATAHGIQSLDPAREGEPLAYYHRSGPAGGLVAAIAEQPERRELALVGAGTGALTALAGPHQRVTLYEIDPFVLQLARDTTYFTFLSEARAAWDPVVGDGRIALERTDRRFDLIVLDAFTGGSIPIHLMTREAIELYLARLRPRGILLFHVSNRHLDLAPILSRHARELGLAGFESVDARTEAESGILGSHWVLLARSPEDMAGIPDTGWRRIRPPGDAPAWTDDFSTLLTAQRWF